MKALKHIPGFELDLQDSFWKNLPRYLDR
jgi:hypothetical protein